jgi:type III secretion protein U
MSEAERTEEPSAQRLRRARERGEVPRSPLASTALVVVGVGTAAWFVAPRAVADWGAFTRSLLSPSPPDPARALGLAAELTSSMLLTPLALAVALGVAGAWVQGAPAWSWSPLSPDLSRLAIGRGVGRMFSRDELTGRSGALASALLVVGIALSVIEAMLPGSLGRVELRAEDTLELGGVAYRALGVRVAAVLVAAGAVAALYRRAQHRRGLRTTRREQQRELRETEGEPRVRLRRTELQRAAASAPALERTVREGTLLVRGATSAAVIAWSRESEAPPRVIEVANGERALRALRRAAEDAALPIVRDETLARELVRGSPRGLGRAGLRRLARHLARTERRPA